MLHNFRQSHIINTLCQTLIGIYPGLDTEAESGPIVAKFVSPDPFDNSRFLWIVLLAAVFIISFAILWLLLKSQHRKGIVLIVHLYHFYQNVLSESISHASPLISLIHVLHQESIRSMITHNYLCSIFNS